MTPARSDAPYAAVLDDFGLYLSKDATQAFKVYRLSINGRFTPERYEWARSVLTPEAFLPALREILPDGVGFVIAFPHVTKIFRFAAEAETLLEVTALDTLTLSPLDLTRSGGFSEFACYAEAIIAADEYDAWARATNVAEYLNVRSMRDTFVIADHAKLASHAPTSVISEQVKPYVREATVADIDAIVGLGREAHAHHAAALPDMFQPEGPEAFTALDVHALFANPQCLLLVAESAGVPVGYLQAEVQDLPATSVKRASRLLYIRQMGVAATYRGSGVGRALLQAVRDRFPRYGVDRMALDVYVFNKAARRLYKSVGFVPVREYQQWMVSADGE